MGIIYNTVCELLRKLNKHEGNFHYNKICIAGKGALKLHVTALTLSILL
jgi:hypothetical protein